MVFTDLSQRLRANIASSSFDLAPLCKGIYPPAAFEIELYVLEKNPPLLVPPVVEFCGGESLFVPRAHRNWESCDRKACSLVAIWLTFLFSVLLGCESLFVTRMYTIADDESRSKRLGGRHVIGGRPPRPTFVIYLFVYVE